MTNKKQIFISGTMRSGGSLINNILSIHPDIMIFGERIHYFRFCYYRYDMDSPKSVERMILHQDLRLRYRFDTAFDIPAIVEAIEKHGGGAKVAYDEMMQFMLRDTGRKIWGEQVALQWREMPHFLNMFPDSCAIHIHRDLRGMLASWKKLTFMPGAMYLGAIFNWIDSINHMLKYKATLPADRYLPVRFENVHQDPESTVQSLCDLVGVPVNPDQLSPEKWPDLFHPKFVEANISAHTGKKVYGFDSKRSSTWKDTLEDWEITLIEFLAGHLLDELGYPRIMKNFDPKLLAYGMEQIASEPFVNQALTTFLTTGEGKQKLPNDPTDAKNWSVIGGTGSEKFVGTPLYAEYCEELEMIENSLSAKYGTV